MNGLHLKRSLTLPFDELPQWNHAVEDNGPSQLQEPERPSAAELARFHRFIQPGMAHSEFLTTPANLDAEPV